MQSGILIAVTIACLVTAVTVFTSAIMCLHLRKGGRVSKKHADEESTLNDFPVTVRKLTINHGNVVTAPPSPGIMSLTKFARFPNSVFTSTARNSTVTTLPEHPKQSLGHGSYDRSFNTSIPSTPRSPLGSVSPASTRPTGDRSRTGKALVPMSEQAWLESISALSHPQAAATDAERVFEEKRAARHVRVPVQEDLPLPSPTVASDQVSMSSRKASLGAISHAAAEEVDRHPSRSQVSGESVQPKRSSSARKQKQRVLVSKFSPSGSPQVNVDIPSPSVSAINTPRSSVHVDTRRIKSERQRRSRPPPITITTSQQPPKVPETFLRSPTESIATVRETAATRKDDASNGLRVDTSAAHDTRKSILSFTSSQYSPTFSIRPAEQVQIMQPPRAQQVSARNSPVLARARPGAAESTPPSTATPKALFPADYSIGGASKYSDSIASRVAPDTPESLISAALQASGFSPPPESRREASALPDRTASEPDLWNAPLTSASVTFPPNLPDFSYSPVEESSRSKPRSKSVRHHDSSHKQRTASAPHVPAAQRSTAELGQEQSEDGRRKKTNTMLARSATVTVAELPVPSTDTIKSVPQALRSTASVSLSELAAKARMERDRARQASRAQMRKQRSG